VTKTLHAQELGAEMAVIVDDKREDHKVIMKDNGYGYRVQIPAIFIDFDYGQKIIDLYNKTDGKVALKVAFKSVKTSVVDVKLFLDNNKASYKLVTKFAEYYTKINKNINFQIIHNAIKCDKCSPNDCYKDGAYCAVHYDHIKSATGQLVMDQQLR
jgi:hypothetical protein